MGLAAYRRVSVASNARRHDLMLRGLINHIDLTSTDLAKSTRFYDQFLGHLGFIRSTEYAGDVPSWTLRSGGAVLSIGLHQARNFTTHDRYAPGIHHLAFHASSREDVDSVGALAVAIGARLLDQPAEYDYTPGYYAVFIADPDGLKLEVVYEPRFAEPPT